MLMEFISQYTSNAYLIALFYLVIWFALIRVGVYILEKIILKIAVRTKTDLDDLILKKSGKPLTFIVLLIGIKIALDKLPWSLETLKIIDMTMNGLIVILAFYLAYVIVGLAFTRVIKRISKKTNAHGNEGLMQLTKSAIQAVIVLLALIILLKSFGIEIGPLLTGIGIGGIAIAFALQSSLGNIFGGVSIILDKSINVGDLVNLDGGVAGRILKIGLRSTKIKTFDNEIIIVPNSKLAESNIHNIAQPEPKSRVVIPFSVAYGTDIEKVRKVVLKEIKKITGFSSDPEPSVRFLEMGESSLNFKAYFFVNSYEDRFNAIDEANTKIYNALRKDKIEIPFPQLDVRLRK